jgi:hypothetical protein
VRECASVQVCLCVYWRVCVRGVNGQYLYALIADCFKCVSGLFLVNNAIAARAWVGVWVVLVEKVCFVVMGPHPYTGHMGHMGQHP